MSFDALRYIASNPDLIAAFGLDTVAATNHYNTVGINEGRPITFDALRYIASNPDLIVYFGLNETGATTHYIANGYTEGRQVNFDALRYIASNPDLIAFFGLNTTGATTHYIANGYGEGRQVNFDALRYIASNPDLIVFFGLNTSAATTHYIANGYTEGRQINFNALRYIASNPDLIAAFGANTTAATTHYIGSGYSEGRSTTAFDPAVYLRNHADLRNAFGSDQAAATQHYITAGVFEGRRTTPFTIDLSDIANGSGGFVINGQCSGDTGGARTYSVGDVNGDGLDDLIVGTSFADPPAGSNAGRSYVVFGRAGTAAVDLSGVAAGTGGFVIQGECAGDRSGRSVSAAGDVNGDGLADLLVGAFFGDPAAGTSAGRSYLVFGKADGTAVDLSAVAAGTGGFSINGESAGDRSGGSVAGIGDLNGDGLADLLVAASWRGSASGGVATRSFVVFGKLGTAEVDLSAVAAGTGGFLIRGECGTDYSEGNVSAAGDVNGDGLADLLMGVPFSAGAAGQNAGNSYVVFGRTASSPVDLTAVANGTGGFAIRGQSAEDRSGTSVAAAGDVNGDGLADLLIGTDTSQNVGVNGGARGRSHVVFGKSSGSTVQLSAVAAGTGGFVIVGACLDDLSGSAVFAAGDVNGDGLGDLIVGATLGGQLGEAPAGRSYLVFGQTGTATVQLSDVALGLGGFMVRGQCAGDYSGFSVAAGGDINGDGLADLLVGATQADPPTGVDAGRSYVIFGSTIGAFNQTAVDQLGDANNNSLGGGTAAETLVGGAGNDTLTSGGGADVIHGGAGNDTIVVSASTLAALASPFGTGGNSSQLARVDGGGGIDTLKLEGSGLTLNLTTVANQGAASPGSSSRFESIERIDLTGSGNNTLTIGLRDVIDLGSFNTFNNASGWADGTYNLAAGGANGANPEQRRQLVIDANSGDVVTLSGWTSVGTVTNNGNTYTVYHQGTFAQLIIDNRATVIAG